MKKTLSLKIDVLKIDKSKLYQGKKGTYLDAILFLNDEDDQYGNNGMIVQSATKEEREQGKKGAILGNSKELVFKTKSQNSSSNESEQDEDQDDLPF